MPISSAPLVVLMNRSKFDNLPKQAQDIIRKYSGEWTAERFIATYNAINGPLMEQLRSDPRRKVIFPSQSEMDRAEAAFKAVTEEAMAENPYLRKLLSVAKAEIAKLRSSK